MCTTNTQSSQRSRLILLLQMGCVGLVAFIIVIVVVVVFGGHKTDEDEACSGSNQCLAIAQCAESSLDFIYSCGKDTKEGEKVCCLPKSLNIATRLSDLVPEDCGSSFLANKIANGLNATLGQFPWIALLGYTSKSLNIPEYLCSGTLINDRYILTAGHCTAIKSKKLSTVRLGELNLRTDIDCEDLEGEHFCGDPPVNIPVEEVIRHPGYNNMTYKNDIAIIRLATNVSEYTDFIKPICLPFSVKVEGKYLTSKKFIVAGWGKTSSSSVGLSNVLQYATVGGWNNTKCTRALPAQVRPVNSTQFCAVGKNFQEACKGDSGGPVMDDIPTDGTSKTTQIGIVSFKALNTCGTENIPTVFTRVDQYLDWIRDNIRN